MAKILSEKTLGLFAKASLPELQQLYNELAQTIIERISQREKEIQEELTQLNKSKTDINGN